ncbi:hypothetical protein [Diaphorobacter aerolatus]|uniref:Uncharacterized protein n=1 Tax=Diaphorobacter aerolatus TaxID=1288495 RepID=A0A7H0GJ85_9BURK|nr:hypothetical protein [Diaphorobacter aerolatus]QNP48351.1 hypothetical protein H9K75_20750 [Diaphorobacter aerolatus]
MKSSFKGEYDTSNNPDGSVDISFKQELFGPGVWWLIIILGTFTLMPAGCAVGSGFNSDNIKGPAPFVMTFLFYFGGIVLITFLTKVKATIKVVPNVGLQWSGKSYPFSDLESIGVDTRVMGNGGKTWSRVYIKGKGRKIYITKQMREPLAEGIKGEIQNVSGINWN